MGVGGVAGGFEVVFSLVSLRPYCWLRVAWLPGNFSLKFRIPPPRHIHDPPLMPFSLEKPLPLPTIRPNIFTAQEKHKQTDRRSAAFIFHLIAISNTYQPRDSALYYTLLLPVLYIISSTRTSCLCIEWLFGSRLIRLNSVFNCRCAGQIARAGASDSRAVH